MKHHERRHPAPPSTIPPTGLVLATETRENGDLVRVLAFALPRPHVRVEVTRGAETHHVVIAQTELATVGNALLRAPRALARGSAS